MGRRKRPYLLFSGDLVKTMLLVGTPRLIKEDQWRKEEEGRSMRVSRLACRAERRRKKEGRSMIAR
jgi:hypothetical protein